MTRLRTTSAILVLAGALACAAVAHGGAPADTTWGIERLARELLDLEPDPSRIATVASLLIERDVATIALENGTLAFARPIGGRVCAAFFHGEGRFILNPRQEIERDQLVRLHKRPTFHRPFQSLLLVFADTTEAWLSQTVSFGAGSYPGDVGKERKGLEGFVEERPRWVDPALARSLLERRRNDLFAAFFGSGRERFRFVVDPYTTEPISLSRLADAVAPTETIVQFRADGRESDDLDRDDREPVAIRSYVIDVTLSPSLHPRYVVEAEGEVLEEGVRFLPLFLGGVAAVDSVISNAERLRFDGSRNGSVLWVDLGSPRPAGDMVRLRVHYRGVGLARREGATTLRAPWAWFPQAGLRQRATFDITFHHPPGVRVVASGNRVAVESTGDGVTARWRILEPSRSPSWCVGRFEDYDARSDSIGVTVVFDPSAHAAQGRELIAEGIASGKNVERQVAQDVLQSVRFFDHVFGPIPQRHFHAVDAWTEHSEATPGMVNLGWHTLQRTQRSGEDEVLRAHEIAHQWWPLHVEYKTYRDRWLSEGLAEFSGLWYMHVARKSPELYGRALAQRRDRILLHPDAGSTWLGHRVETARTIGPDYVVAVYDKGAWIFHMLRNYLIDLKTLDETRFVETLRDFHATHRGREASTADFRRIVEKHVGHDMAWFFRQWVQGTAIPEYRVAWRSAVDDSGRHVLKLRVEQHDVPDGFRMPVLVRVDLGEGRFARSRIWIDQPVVETAIALPLPAREMTFNELESVLCVVRKTKWPEGP